MRNTLRRAAGRIRLPAAIVLAAIVCLICTAAAEADLIKETNVTYAKVGDRELQVDLARPDGEGPFPAIVFIHGGGWVGGNRSAYHGEVFRAASRGYFAMTVTYRLIEPDKETKKAKYPFPAAVHDVKAAVRWLRANAQKYKVDPDRIGVIGASAGGHLSLMVGLSDKSANLEGDGGNADQSSRVQAVVNYFGPTDMIRMVENSQLGGPDYVKQFLAGDPTQIRDSFLASSPVTHATKDDPPVLTLHGDKDLLVPLEQATLLDKKMKEVGANHTLLVIEGQAHGFKDATGKKAADAMDAFFDKHLKSAK